MIDLLVRANEWKRQCMRLTNGWKAMQTVTFRCKEPSRQKKDNGEYIFETGGHEEDEYNGEVYIPIDESGEYLAFTYATW